MTCTAAGVTGQMFADEAEMPAALLGREARWRAQPRCVVLALNIGRACRSSSRAELDVAALSSSVKPQFRLACPLKAGQEKTSFLFLL